MFLRGRKNLRIMEGLSTRVLTSKFCPQVGGSQVKFFSSGHYLVMVVYQEHNSGVSVNTAQSRVACGETGVGVWTALGDGWTRPGRGRGSRVERSGQIWEMFRK